MKKDPGAEQSLVSGPARLERDGEWSSVVPVGATDMLHESEVVQSAHLYAYIHGKLL